MSPALSSSLIICTALFTPVTESYKKNTMYLSVLDMSSSLILLLVKVGEHVICYDPLLFYINCLRFKVQFSFVAFHPLAYMYFIGSLSSPLNNPPLKSLFLYIM